MHSNQPKFRMQATAGGPAGNTESKVSAARRA